MTKSLVNIDVRNGADQEQVKLSAVVLMDPATGLPVVGGGARGKTIDFELLLIQDSTAVIGLRREVRVDDLITVQYETLDGATWVPVPPVTLVSPALPLGAANSTKQDSTITAIGTSNAALGAPGDTVAATDTASGSLIAYMKRLASNITSLRGQIPTTLGVKTASASLSTTPASDANIARETYTTVTITAANTDATGTAYVSFSSVACSSIDLINSTGVAIEVRRGGSGNTLILKDGQTRRMRGITNANNIQFRRQDLSTTPVLVAAEAYVV